MFPIKWLADGIENECPDGGILVEIWKTGGIVQTSTAIPTGSWVELAPNSRHTIQAQVTGCEQDDYGFLVSISVNQSQYQNWFPQSYCPQYLRLDDDQEVYLSQNTLW
jgi:hypothetical protein